MTIIARQVCRLFAPAHGLVLPGALPAVRELAELLSRSVVRARLVAHCEAVPSALPCRFEATLALAEQMGTDARDEPAQASELRAWMVRLARRGVARVRWEEAAVPESAVRNA